MSNKYFNRDAAPSHQTGGEGGSNKAQGSGPSISMPEKTANWPGLPGKASPDRSAGVPKEGAITKFRVDQEGM